MDNIYFENIDYYILKALKSAEKRLLIAVAWFTNLEIGNEVLNKSNLDIEIIVDDNSVNRKSENLIMLLKNNIDIKFVKNLDRKYAIMHNKFCVIDNLHVITGSYNWTNNALNNDENILIIKDRIAAAYFSQEFRRIKEIEDFRKNPFLSTQEADEIINLIVVDIKEILRVDIRNLKAGSLLLLYNEKIKNKIRLLNESVLNVIKQKPPTILVYLDLIRKYGFDFNKKATKEELIFARDTFQKLDLDKIDDSVDRDFQYFKIKAIAGLQEKYRKKLKENLDDEASDRIIKVHQFLQIEKISLANQIEINLP